MCSAPSDPSNGMVTTTGLSIGADATFTCDSGFEVDGDEVTTCTRTGPSTAEFTPDSPICSRKYFLPWPGRPRELE